MKWLDDLNASQMSVLLLVADGLTFEEIADTLKYSHKTLSRILSRIEAKISAARAGA